jgi:hypothetical protein
MLNSEQQESNEESRHRADEWFTRAIAEAVDDIRRDVNLIKWMFGGLLAAALVLSGLVLLR